MNALIVIADGTEEMEAVIVIDVLRRAGTEVTVASVGNIDIVASRGVGIKADVLIGDCVHEVYDLIVLPGGMPGAENLRDSEPLAEMLEKQNAAGRLIGAICAAPAVILLSHGLLKSRKATCHPSFFDMLPDEMQSNDRVLDYENCITSQGPGTAMEFALRLVERQHGKEIAKNVAESMCV